MEISKEQNVIIFKLEMIAYNLIKILVVCPVFFRRCFNCCPKLWSKFLALEKATLVSVGGGGGEPCCLTSLCYVYPSELM